MISNKATLADVPNEEIKGKTVLMRVDYNVPLSSDSKSVSDKTRIIATMGTIGEIFERGAKSLVLMSHLGRPDGAVIEKFSMKPVVPVLAELLKTSEKTKALNLNLKFLNDCVGPDIVKAVKEAQQGDIFLLENLRFHVEEEGSGVDPKTKEKTKAKKEAVEAFCKSLTELGDSVFVNDAFGTCHRAHASMVGVNLKYKVAGGLLSKELTFFGKVMENPSKPFLVIIGGAKVKDKIQLIMNLLDKVDAMLIVGGMAFTFLKVLQNMNIGKSLYDEEGAKVVPEIMKKAAEKNVRIILPVDFVAGDKFAADARVKYFNKYDDDGIDEDWMGLDIGEQSINNCKSIIEEAKTIVWNGPAGVFEFPNFAKGSIAILDAVVQATKRGAVTVIGGGDTASLVEGQGKADKVSHVSTGGGASLELLEGKALPGVTALSAKGQGARSSVSSPKKSSIIPLSPSPAVKAKDGRSRAIGIVGAGAVGAAIASSIIARNVVSQIYMNDYKQDLCEAVCLDLEDEGFRNSVRVSPCSPQEMKERCGIIVIAAGAKQEPGEPRTNLVKRNAKILQSILTSMFPLNPDTIVVLVTNPVDVLTAIAQKICEGQIPAHQVIGSGTYLDSQRFRVSLAKKLNVSVRSVHSYVLGEHGDSQVLALSAATIGGCRLSDVQKEVNMTEDDLKRIAQEVRGKAYAIIKGQGATYHGIGECVSSICESIFLDKRDIFPLSNLVPKYNSVIGWPCVVGTQGVLHVMPLTLAKDEEERIVKSGDIIRNLANEAIADLSLGKK